MMNSVKSNFFNWWRKKDMTYSAYNDYSGGLWSGFLITILFLGNDGRALLCDSHYSEKSILPYSNDPIFKLVAFEKSKRTVS